jgi:hypothetical protein
VGLGCALLGACAPVQPYQRGKLTHPTMQIEAGAGPAAAHVYAVHEGAVGGTIGAEGGCGCN